MNPRSIANSTVRVRRFPWNHRLRGFVAMVLLGIAPFATRVAAMPTPKVADREKDLLVPGVAEGALFDSEIVAVVNRTVVTRQEIEAALEPALRRLGTKDPRVEVELKLRLLLQLIMNKIKDDAAARYQHVVQPRQVERKIQERMKEAGSEEEFRSALSESGITLEELRRDLKKEIARQDFLRTELGLRAARRVNQRTKHDVDVGPTDLRNYYESHPEQFRLPTRARIRRIYISAKRLGDEPAFAEIERLRRMVQEEGADFAELARQHSNEKHSATGGDLGWIDENDETHSSPIVRFAMSGSVGEASSVMTVPHGYFVLFVEERIEARNRPFAEVQEEIRVVVWNKKAEAVFRAIELELIEEAFLYPFELKDLLVRSIRAEEAR